MADTPALRALADIGIPFEVAENTRSRSVEEAAAKRGVPVGQLLKTIVVRRGDDDFLFVLVPGDRGIDWAKLRAHLGVRRMNLPDAEEALAVTGYERGTITPFGATTAWPVVADSSIDPDSQVSIGGGAHGVSVKLQAHLLIEAVGAEVADVTKPLG
ncbi:MAG: aminoacyl-tRNA deacylase [Acidimicrobiia bacterium]|nr:aminoacyl-tRNA deacylase [Acidimicrobiia bacterium]